MTFVGAQIKGKIYLIGGEPASRIPIKSVWEGTIK
jgi:hypothetical protein